MFVIIKRFELAFFHPAGTTISSSAGGNKSSASLAIFSTAGTIVYSFSQLIFSYFTKYMGFHNSYLLAFPGIILAAVMHLITGHRIAPEIKSTISDILMGFAWATSSFGSTVCALINDKLPFFSGLTSGLVILSIFPLIAGFIVHFLLPNIQDDIDKAIAG